MLNSLNIKEMSILVLAFVLATVLASLGLVAGELMYIVGFVKVVYTVFIVLAASIIPLMVMSNT